MHLPGMSLIPRGLSIPIHAPTAADIYKCDPAYGTNIVPLDCETAVIGWPKTKTPINYYLKDPAPSNSEKLPLTDHYGSCSVSVEHAGPSPFPDYLTIAPNKILGLAGYVMQKCVDEKRGIGGFVTLNLKAAAAYVAAINGIDLYRDATQIGGNVTNGAFVTVSITGSDSFELRPGDTDPMWAGYLSALAGRLSQRSMSGYSTQVLASLRETALRLRNRVSEMTIGGAQTWWQGLADNVNSQVAPTDPELQDTATSRFREGTGESGVDPGKMTYQCDGDLGGPDPTDCELLSYSGLGKRTDMEALEANITKFYTQGTCSLGVSSAVATTISWAHLLTAFQTLNNLCVQNPIASIRGGRAYYGQQSVISWINGKRDSISGVDDSEVLPQGINATIFRHDPMSEETCEWKLAQVGSSVSGCEVG